MTREFFFQIQKTRLTFQNLIEMYYSMKEEEIEMGGSWRCMNETIEEVKEMSLAIID